MPTYLVCSKKGAGVHSLHPILRCTFSKATLSAVHTNEGRLFQTVGAQHENRREAVFVDKDCVDSRSDADVPCKCF